MKVNQISGRQTLSGILGISALAVSLSASGQNQRARPNVVIIMADDLGYGDIGCFGNETIKTPVLDKMAGEGIRFTSYYSNGAVCTPTRAALLTGRYQQRAGLEGVIYAALDKRHAGGIRDGEVTLGEVFQENGYQTGIFGKWHLGYDRQYNPLRHGFHEFYGFVSGNVDYISHRDGVGIYDWWHNADSVYEEGYLTDLITHKALGFMEKNRKVPFFLYLPHGAPHYPYQGRKDPADRLPGQKFPGQGSRTDRKEAYKEMIEVMDENIGRIFAKLRELGLDENTFVFFCSDNGAVEVGSNGVLRNRKSTLWEGGIRVPAIAWYPPKIGKGKVDGSVVASMDLMPTVLSIAGIDLPVKADGIDFSPVLFNEGPIPDRPLFWRHSKQRAVREGKWKYLKAGENAYLFDLSTDISETTDLKEVHPMVFRNLASKMDAWEAEMGIYKQFTR
jgi:arylsulfatase A